MNLRIGVNRLFRHVGLSLHRWPPPNTVDKLLQRLLPELGVDCVIDVGANRGQFAHGLREIGFSGTILSFEPNPALRPALDAASTSDPRWHVFSEALGDADGTLRLHVPAGDDLASALTSNTYGRTTFAEGMREGRDEDVPVRRLDGALSRLQARYGFARPFLKMDTQGYDLHVLRGAEGIWEELAGLMSEVSFKPLYDEMPDVTESLAAIRAAGFEVAGLFPVVHDSTGAMIEMDCVARRAK